MRDKIVKLVTDAVHEETGQWLDETSTVYGYGGIVDSLGLVNIVLMVEERFNEEFNQSIVLASEKAMSQKSSPFRSIGSLSDYLMGER